MNLSKQENAMVKPGVLVLGSQKAGTSWAHRCLREHPEIFIPVGKRDDHPLGRHPYTDDNEFSYFDDFTSASPYQIIADTSVDYLYHASMCAPVIAKYIPDCKFIVFLRDPAERAVSACMWGIRSGHIRPASMEDGILRALDTDAGENHNFYRSVIERGFYAEQLKVYFQYFTPAKFLIVFYDDLRESPANVISKTYDFMGCDPYFQPPSLHSRPKKSTNYHAAVAESYVRSLTGNISFKLNKILSWLIAASFGRIYKDDPRDRISATLRSQLSDIYASRNCELAELLKNQACNVFTEKTLNQLPEKWNRQQ